MKTLCLSFLFFFLLLEKKFTLNGTHFQNIKTELIKLLDIAKDVKYDNVTVSPLYYSAMKYYDDVYYRVIQNNLTIAKGGGYQSDGIGSLGFALYTDNLLKILED